VIAERRELEQLIHLQSLRLDALSDRLSLLERQLDFLRRRLDAVVHPPTDKQ
jgi:hypothetical protein